MLAYFCLAISVGLNAKQNSKTVPEAVCSRSCFVQFLKEPGGHAAVPKTSSLLRPNMANQASMTSHDGKTALEFSMEEVANPCTGVPLGFG